MINLQPEKSPGGGVEAQRGFVFQTYSVLLYLLIRHIELSAASASLGVRDLQTVLESEEGEDAKFISLVMEGSAPLQVTELVQCKKIERSSSVKIHAGLTPDDTWRMGPIDYPVFESWLTAKRNGQSVIDLLSASEQLFYTALVFGEPTRRVERFVPRNIRQAGWLHWYSPIFTRAFPINYKHADDPAANSLGKPEIRKRIRVLVVDSPGELEAQCSLLLHQYFNIGEHKAPEIVRRLRSEIERRTISKDPNSRSLSQGEIDEIIASGREPQGKWQEAGLFMRCDEPRPADPNRGESLGFTDFAESRYLDRPEFAEAWRYLDEKGCVVISGPAGSGRSTLARFLAYQFLAAKSERRAYYLTVRPTESYADEIKFFLSQVYTQTLFIIDDQNLAVSKIEELAQAFMDLRAEMKTAARLVVTSTITYSLALASARLQTRSVLNEMPSVRLNRPTAVDIARIVDTLKTSAGLVTRLSGDEVAQLTHDNLKVGLILARCSGELRGPLSADRLLKSKGVARLLGEWLLERFGRSGQWDFYKDQVVPVFIVGSRNLPIPEDFRKSVNALVDAGFLEAEDNGTNSRVFHISNRRVAAILRQPYEDQQLPVFSEYLRHNLKLLPFICEQLNTQDADRSLLHDLAETHFNDFVRAINDDLDPIDLEGISNILNALYTCHRSLSRKLLLTLTSPNGQPNSLFFVKFIRLERVRNARSLRKFFQVLDRVSRYPVRQLAFDDMGFRQRRIIQGFLDSDLCSLDEVAASLHSIMRCSRTLAKSLYEELSESPVLLSKMAQADLDPNGLSIWLRFCEEIKSLDRNESRKYVDIHLTTDRIVHAMFKTDDFSPWSRLLLRFRRLQPRLTAELGLDLARDHLDALEKRVRAENKLQAVTNELYALSRVNRRLGVLIAKRITDHLKNLVSAQQNFRIVGSTLDSLRTNLSLTLAQSVVGSIREDVILSNLKSENSQLDLVGKFLVTVHSVSLDLAAWFEKNLDYRDYLTRTLIGHFTDLVYLMRGLLIAADQNEKAKRLQDFLSDALWLREFRQGWDTAPTLSEHALCISLLLDVPLDKQHILQVLSFPNVNAFEEEMLRRLDEESDILHIANCLYAVAKIDFSIALNALGRYVERTEARRNREKAAREAARTTRPRQPSSAANYNAPNMAHVGYILQIAASIEPDYALRLAIGMNLELFILSARDESNLGRVDDFILGLLKASRELATRFVENTSSIEIWSRQWEENEEFENIIHYARALSEANWSKGREYVNFLLKHQGDVIYSILEVEANLMLVSNWLRVLAKGDRDLVPDHIQSIANLAVSVAAIDTRVWHLLEAAEALIECGQKAAADDMSLRAAAEASQLRNREKIRDWVVLYHKTLRLSRELNRPELPKAMFSQIDRWRFFEILGSESQPVLLAYLFNIHELIEESGLENIAAAVVQRHPDMLFKARAERSAVHQLLALILLKTPPEEIREIVRQMNWTELWPAGLAALIFAHSYPNEKALFDGPISTQENSEPSPSDWNSLLMKSTSAHRGNLEFAMVKYLTSLTGGYTDVLEQIASAADERIHSEPRERVRWLLREEPSRLNLRTRPFYMWAYLKDTVLRPTYLVNDAIIQKTVDSKSHDEEFVGRLTRVS